MPVSLHASQRVGGHIERTYTRVGEIDLSLDDAQAMAGILLALAAIGRHTSRRTD